MFKNAFSFEGRIRRTEYGLSIIIYIISLSILQIPVADNPNSDVIPGLFLILAIPIIWFMIAQGAKRCHDLGNSGWFQLIPFYNLWIIFADSNYGNNGYGPNPKGIGNIDEIDDIGSHLN